MSNNHSFLSETELFNYMVETHTEGKVKEATAKFTSLARNCKKAFVSWMQHNATPQETLSFYFNLL